ncbi:hypothetical protein Gohar_017061 [Gossypium harknessii]|uniref:Uncharacterized protein n=1 Tax=Gossypium harknessii TaxID=34285 RepID=A0A7J9G4S9_9ROSI|nr:hypothetical protein [Gossypium harknessii]
MRPSRYGLRQRSKRRVIVLQRADKHHGDERAVVAARIKQKGDNKCIPWRNLRDLILAHPDVKKRVDVFALSIYGLLIFSKALGHIDEAVSDLFDRLDKRVTPVPLVATSRRNDITEEKWIMILQILQDKDVEWKALWMVTDEILYRCGDFDWVPFLRIWGLSAGTGCRRQKLETEKLRKGKNKAEEDLDGLKTDYKKLRMSMRTAGLRKTLDQWRQEIQKEKSRVSRWERKFQEAQARKDVLKRSLLESQNEKVGLKTRVSDLERSLHQYRSYNSAIKLKASLSKIEEPKGRIEELETVLPNYELRVELLEANNE